ncbi:MAG: hypothetical protein HS117_15715 [Verrucomicrobiaceae bacterium]|nr:hypothetical protein [Verrucomicrobiaceae bacterium]
MPLPHAAVHQRLVAPAAVDGHAVSHAGDSTRHAGGQPVAVGETGGKKGGATTMRSQKQNNRSPRPFKNQQTSGRWSGGSGGGFIPPPKFPQPVKKKEAKPGQEPN